MDDLGARARGQLAAAGEAPARPPALLRLLLDLRLRRRHDRGADRRRRLGDGPRPRRARLVAHRQPRALLQQHPPLGGGAFLLRDGRPPLGQVLHGGLARRPRAHLGDRRDHLPGRDRRGLHRLPLTAELRLAVDRQRGQGRAQLGRGRRLLQRRRLRPDVHIPRDPAAAGGGRAGRLARPAGTPPRCRPALPGEVRSTRAAARRAVEGAAR